MSDESGSVPVELRGIAASGGIAIGHAYIVDRRGLKIPHRSISEDDVTEELARFNHAIERCDREFERIKAKIGAEKNENSNIVTVHQLMLRDQQLLKSTLEKIADDRINAEWALQKSVERIKKVFDTIEDDYFRERRSDIEFVADRVYRILLGRVLKMSPPPDAIVVAHDLGPADTVQLHRAKVIGLATDVGGKTSHTAIVARSHEIPAVVGLETLTDATSNGDLIIVDGTSGVVIVQPSSDVLSLYRERSRQHVARGIALQANKNRRALTSDGTAVTLLANLDHEGEVAVALQRGAEGVGLFRSEYAYMTSETLPSEEDQYQSARSILEAMGTRAVTMRTLDLGADKMSKHIPLQHAESNPALGLRSLRLCLSEPMRPFFRAQIRAFLRASVHGTLKIMLPMVSGLEELRDGLALIREVQSELQSESIAFDSQTPIGIMVEMPSAALVADHLAKEVDFFSLGTNDLIQYTLAVDRVNEHVSYLYQPTHPAILRLIDRVVRAAKAAHIPVSICGEAAGNALMLPLLIGLGLRQLSMSAFAIPVVKEALGRLALADAEELAANALNLPTSSDVQLSVEKFLAQQAPSV